MISSLDPSGWLTTLARKLLYLWVRARVLPENARDLAVDANKPVCYVLEDQRFTNMLVLIEEVERRSLPAAHSLFFLKRFQSLPTPARERYSHAPLMATLIERLLAEPGADVQIIPVTILWGRAPGSQDSILKALFAETWGPIGHVRQWLAVLLHGRQTLVHFNAPLSLRQLLGDESRQDKALRKLSRVLRVHFRLQRQRLIGPDLSHRNTQVATLLATPAVRLAIQAEASTRGISVAAAQENARRFALEIPSDYSHGVVRAFELLLDWLWTRLYDGIEVRNFDVVERIPPGSGIVYLPCHRSHIDYLLLSFIVYRRGLTPPHVAAGINLNMPLIGPLLRRAGAFFLRRSFKGEPLYAAVFHEYLHLMISRGFAVEYFIEGGRSRGGRMLAPRTGILGMTVRSFLRDHGHQLMFVPVYVGYEKLIEGRSFVKELEGKPKRGESLLGLLNMARKLRHDFGKVHVNFGRPLSLAEFLDTEQPGWSAQAGIDPYAAWVRQATQSVALELTRRINAAAVVTPVGLVALGLLAAPKLCMDEQGLHRLMGHYRALSVPSLLGSDAAACTMSDADCLAHVLRLGFVERLPHALGDLIRVRTDQTALMAYFRNNVLHLFALPAVVACLLGQNPHLPRKRCEAAVAGIYGLLRPELFLQCTANDLPAMLAETLTIMENRALLRRGDDAAASLIAAEANSEEFAELHLLGETIRPTLERHFLTLALLQRRGSGHWLRKDLEESGHLLAQRLALLYEFNAPEFADKAVFAGVVANLLDAGLLREDDAGLLHFDERISAPAEHTELLLPAEVRRAVYRLTAGDRLIDAGPVKR